MDFRRVLNYVPLLLLVLQGCKEDKVPINLLQNQIDEIGKEVAPDKRVALFDIKAIKDNDTYILKGESNLPNAIEALKTRLSAENVDYIDSIQLLPTKALEGKTQGVITISVANLRSQPKHSAELATQATLGTPVKVYKKSDGWYLIQTPDQYLSWVDSGGIQLMDSISANQWRSSDKIIFTKTYGHTYATTDVTSQVVSDMVAGAVLEKLGEDKGFYKVKYPDSRIAYILKGEAQDYNQWLQDLNPTTDALVETSKKLMGVPYLWGGTSTKGVDCSGFTKTIYFLNGMVIPRDASQQVHTGKSIDSLKNFDDLVKGDLLFFGRKATDSTPEKVVHVGMWIGNNEFIHSSNMVRISSMDPKAPNFDEWNLKRYLRTKRILKEEEDGLINLANTPIFKD
ncbi:C40 family peptidase [Maribacter polysiphoniae]|uniref:C40 family peptidase n=1 Tax=Maribacter polysiphoniae TaxID=429344 RepID=A0A316E618_9FLAO|nr:C40 family peptidase [Maribacter polysiphoniae]MBD1260057.1 C40 family peptidase [Maribacter polysiphoniae]PWK25516.1 SH3 domain-containing protein [Maribacter polysiphoniae]